LAEKTRYSVVVNNGIKDSTGQPVIACGITCTSIFTTETATSELAKLRAALDNGTAYTNAGIGTANRGASFVQGGVRDVFPAATVMQIERGDQVYASVSRPGPGLGSRLHQLRRDDRDRSGRTWADLGGADS